MGFKQGCYIEDAEIVSRDRFRVVVEDGELKALVYLPDESEVVVSFFGSFFDGTAI